MVNCFGRWVFSIMITMCCKRTIMIQLHVFRYYVWCTVTNMGVVVNLCWLSHCWKSTTLQVLWSTNAQNLLCRLISKDPPPLCLWSVACHNHNAWHIAITPNHSDIYLKLYCKYCRVSRTQLHVYSINCLKEIIIVQHFHFHNTFITNPSLFVV